MKRIIYLATLAVVLTACSLDQTELPTFVIGEDFTDTNVRIITIDTFTVELSTFKFDSIVTSSTERLLIGRYEDEEFGNVRASTFFEMTTIDFDISADAELDSVALVLGYDRYFYNDTLQPNEIKVHLLEDELNPEDDFFYNTSVSAFNEVPLAEITYMPEPREDDSLHIPLPFEFGEPLFELIQDGTISNDFDLRQNLKGFSLQPGDVDDGSVLGFSVSTEETYLRFFFTIRDEFGDINDFYDLAINPNATSPAYFNNIQRDPGNTAIAELTDQEFNLGSTAAGDRTFIQSGVGIVTRVRFPSIRSMYQVPGTGTVIRANLQIKPVSSSFDDSRPIRDSLAMSVVDANNEIDRALINGSGFVTAVLNRDDEEYGAVFYEIPVGVYIDEKLNEDFIVDDALIIIPVDFGATVDRYVLNGEESQEFEAKLVLTYAIYDE